MSSRTTTTTTTASTTTTAGSTSAAKIFSPSPDGDSDDLWKSLVTVVADLMYENEL